MNNITESVLWMVSVDSWYCNYICVEETNLSLNNLISNICLSCVLFLCANLNTAVAATGGIIEEGKAADNDTVAKDESNEVRCKQ